MLAINPHRTERERSEQKGFANLVRGTFGMFRKRPNGSTGRGRLGQGRRPTRDNTQLP